MTTPTFMWLASKLIPKPFTISRMIGIRKAIRMADGSRMICLTSFRAKPRMRMATLMDVSWRMSCQG